MVQEGFYILELIMNPRFTDVLAHIFSRASYYFVFFQNGNATCSHICLFSKDDTDSFKINVLQGLISCL